jgi:hypothetical protein
MSQENVEIARRWVEDHPPPEAFVPVEYIDAGDAVVLVCRVEIEFRGADQSIDHWSVFEVRDGKVVAWQPHAGNKRAALEAAGLSEQVGPEEKDPGRVSYVLRPQRSTADG